MNRIETNRRSEPTTLAAAIVGTATPGIGRPGPRLRALGLAALVAASAWWSVGCWQTMCSPGEIERELLCFPAPAAAPDAAPEVDGTDAAADETGEAGTAVAADTFGKPCTGPSDCSGKSPICAPAPLGYCTNVQCSPGEANAGVCPTGFMCFPAASGNPSACIKSGS